MPRLDATLSAWCRRSSCSQFWIWQLATYMFLHGGLFHILFNMLALWMFGAELERIWGTRYFLKFYFVTGIGAGALTVLFSLLPFAFAQQLQHSVIDRRVRRDLRAAAGLRAVFPGSADLHVLVFSVPAKCCVAIMGAIALFSSLSDARRRRQRDASRRPARRLPVS